ncbi:MAG: hypothetical protein OET08_03685 [Desulfuromonadales bacterium]|nr:hypothetical protein [Desulfuromonadales bacterium]
MIDTDIGINDHTIFTDDVAGRHRQCPTWVGVMTFEIDTEGEINLPQIVRNVKDQSKLVGNGVILIAENRDGEIVLFDDLASKLRSRWRYCQQVGAKVSNGIVDRLQSFQLRIAIRSPGASIKVED